MPGGLLNRTLGPKMKTPARKPLRLWPGVVIAILLCLVRFVVPVVVPDATLVGVLAVPIGVLAIVLWWVFFSRAPWSERLGAVGLIVAALFATSRDRKSTRLNSSHLVISYAVFCLKKKK